MNVAQTEFAVHTTPQGGRCNFCQSTLPDDLQAQLSDGCPTCAASWRDQYIAELLMGLECLDGVRHVSRLSQVLEARDRRMAVIGRLFQRDNTALTGQCQQFTASQLRKLARRRIRLPIKAQSLDYLLVSDADSMIFSLEEAARVLTDTGVFVVFWPQNSQASGANQDTTDQRMTAFSTTERLMDRAKKEGLIGWFDLPGLGISQLQHLRAFVAVKHPSTASQANGPKGTASLHAAQKC